MASVLIIEDDPQVLSTLAEVLVTTGHTVRSATSADTAISELERSFVLDPECVVLDYAVHGLDPLQFITRFKVRFPDAKVILSSGYPENFLKREFNFEQIDQFISKPFSPIELAKTIGIVVGEA